ncbi:HAD family hydrolase [Litchfieldia alkalitelluris]|uniref:HAD family hydrolase n=1 Tax=Litchfieldia alkalitelluris TaxID=304268 RepID=UPI0009980213|nr:HAD family hydrolase [Litchfieldia alkalitelluris]
MTNYSILFLDIDGTILTSDDSIQESTKEAVKQVQAKGIEVFLATGRPLHEIWDIGKTLNVDAFIGYNGAYAIRNHKEIYNKPIDSTTVEKYLQTAKQYGHELVMYTNKKNVMSSLESERIKEFITKFHLKHNEEYTPAVIDKILGMTVVNVNADEQALYNEEGIHLSQVNLEGFHHCYDVIRDTANKGQAVKMVLNQLNIDPKASIAFGDGMNDKEMLSVVGEGFSMGNAHPQLHTYAKHQTTSVEDSGIFNGLKSLGLVK